MTSRVECYDCGNTFAFPRARCPCGEPLWFETVHAPEPGVGRLAHFADSLPVEPRHGLAQAVGGTPLVRAPALDEYAGCRLSIKSETGNPTGSFKDRGSAVGVAWATREDRPVGTVSHGNMAASMAAHAAAAGVDCTVLVPADISDGRLRRIAQYGPDVLRVDGDYGRLYRLSLEIGRDTGVAFVNSDTPLRVAGQKTVAFEILAESEPDAIVLPVSSGGHASAVWKGLLELEAAGRLDRLPRLLLVQAAACDPIARAFRDGRDRVDSVEPGETVAYSIANPDPPSGNRALAAVESTAGAVVSVDDEAILDARSRLARSAGMSVEPASATALAGLRKLGRTGSVSPDESVVLIATGTGRTTDHGPVDVPTVPIDDLRERIRIVGAPGPSRDDG